MNDPGARNQLQSEAFVDELVRNGLRHVCICPGSRSTPLALALARHPGIQHWVLIDERSCSYFAHGMARQLGEPVAILCSSGTAAANFFPAIVESFYDRVPLIVLTADRPPELRQFGAAQTINQIQIYGTHVKWFVDMPVPDDLASLDSHARVVAARAVSTAMNSPQGPVHLNFPFREPLLPADGNAVTPDNTNRNLRAPISVSSGCQLPDRSYADHLAARLRKIERGLIVCGPQRDPAFAEAIVELAGTLGWPVLADPLSQARCGEHELSQVIDSYDIFLRDQGVGDWLSPDLVMRFGAMPTSKSLMLYLQRLPEAEIVLVEDGDIWRDQTFSITEVIQADPVSLCKLLSSQMHGNTQSAASQMWLLQWQEIQLATRKNLRSEISVNHEFSEGRVFAELAGIVPSGATIYAGNSMPVRDLDAFFPALGKEVKFHSNRGANGIDGVVSSALGAAAVSIEPLVLVIGDLSFYHDMNGLLAAKKYEISATIILVNNNGGGIFHFLPQNTELENQMFEDLFGTPTGIDFASLIDLYDVDFVQPDNWVAFRDEVQSSINGSGVKVIEVATNRVENLQEHRQIVRSVLDSLPAKSPVVAD